MNDCYDILSLFIISLILNFILAFNFIKNYKIWKNENKILSDIINVLRRNKKIK